VRRLFDGEPGEESQLDDSYLLAAPLTPDPDAPDDTREGGRPDTSNGT
jgi:hypothetical protein